MKQPILTLARKGASGARPSCAIVLVNGYLSETKRLAEDNEKWWSGLHACGWNGSVYHLWWDASHKLGVGAHIAKASGVVAAIATGVPVGGPVVVGAVGTALGVGTFAHWKKVKSRAKRTGAQYVPKLLRKEIEADEIILIGHSAGARVVHYALRNYKHDSPAIRDVILTGGAIGRGPDRPWDKAVEPIRGKLYNVYHSKDRVLQFLYKAAVAGQKSPCGIRPIKTEAFSEACAEKIVNVDATEFGSDGASNHWIYRKTLKKTVGHVLCGNADALAGV